MKDVYILLCLPKWPGSYNGKHQAISEKYGSSSWLSIPRCEVRPTQLCIRSAKVSHLCLHVLYMTRHYLMLFVKMESRFPVTFKLWWEEFRELMTWLSPLDLPKTLHSSTDARTPHFPEASPAGMNIYPKEYQQALQEIAKATEGALCIPTTSD